MSKESKRRKEENERKLIKLLKMKDSALLVNLCFTGTHYLMFSRHQDIGNFMFSLSLNLSLNLLYFVRFFWNPLP